MIPMCMASTTNRTGSSEGFVPAELLCPRDVGVSGRMRRMKDFEELRGNGGAGDTAVSQRHRGDCESEGQTQRWKIQQLRGRSTTGH
jgi:hypothetical protein